LCRQIVRLRPKRLVLVEMTEHALYQIESELNEIIKADSLAVPVEPELLTLVNEQATDRLFERWQPDTVFHAAAYKHVPLVERNVISGLRNNIMGTRNAAYAAKRAGVERFVLISTDKAVRPTNVMGASKRICEQILQGLSTPDSGTRFAMVRFGNVLGSSGSVVPRFKRQIREGGPVTITHRDITRYFMTIPEAAQLVIQAGAMARGGEVYLLDMGESIRIFDLAQTMISLSGVTVRDEHNPGGEIEIVEIGLRPGEKLYEELLIDAEAEETVHPRIRRAREGMLDIGVLNRLLADLFDRLERGDRAGALVILQDLVPEYMSGHGSGFPPGKAAAFAASATTSNYLTQ
jgi:FlaA1/EpsC-like NDP-sugar epimerase